MTRYRGEWSKPWRPTGFVSETCQTLIGTRMDHQCGRRAVMAYPAMGGGYHALCHEHGQKHADYCVSIPDARMGKEPKGWGVRA